MSDIILPLESNIHQLFQQLVAQRQMVFLAGLPGTGKSLLLKQLALMAEQSGRTVHMLQWDVSRLAFETTVILQKYPEIEGVTHPAIRKAVGLWARQGVAQWFDTYAETDHMLLGEVPLVGNRLSELTQSLPDEAEAVLASDKMFFVVPVPSVHVRQTIESARAQSIANPRHEKERNDAQPNVLNLLWCDVAQAGYELGFTTVKPADTVVYDPDIYAAVYDHLLVHRKREMLPIDTVLNPNGSAYELVISGSELSATPEEVDAIMNRIETQMTEGELETAVSNWYKI
jgi:hypothetical protein